MKNYRLRKGYLGKHKQLKNPKTKKNISRKLQLEATKRAVEEYNDDRMNRFGME